MARQGHLHYEGAESMIEEVPLVEAPSRPSRKSWWYVAGAGVASLVVVGFAKAVFPSSLTFGKTSGVMSMQEVQHWEDIPGIDKVIQKAQSLRHEKPLRNLQDLFYDSQPEELPWIRTECVIDVVQAAAYLDQAIVFLYKAIDYNGLECPNNSPVGCAASVAGFLTSISWIASYLSFAANACGQAVNNGALCAGDFTALTANFGEIATVGAAARADCNFEKNVHAILTNPEPKEAPGYLQAADSRRLDEAPDRMLPTRKWTQFVPAGAAPAVEKYVKVKGHVEANRNRGFDIAQCVADVTNSAAYIVRVILQLRTAVSSCADPKACAINVMNIISSFAWISQFTALAVADCQVGVDQKALCTADISDARLCWGSNRPVC